MAKAVTGWADLVIASNRGPVSFTMDGDGLLVRHDGSGGLVSTLRPLIEGTGATWVAAAMSPGDRRAAAEGLMTTEGMRVAPVVVDEDIYRMAYDVIANSALWFLHHHLYDLSRRPRIDHHWKEAWNAYRALNRAFAETIAQAARPGALVLVQDYHLALVGEFLPGMRPDLRTVHFSHTPFCAPEMLAPLPDTCARELIAGMAGFGARGFHSQRWAAAYRGCAHLVLGSEPSTFVAPLGPDPAHLETCASAPERERNRTWLAEHVGERKMILRVDRMEPSKNLLRGFFALDELLANSPQWRGEVVFVALLNLSRQSLALYRTYQAEVETAAAYVNARWGTDDWTPVVLDVTDDFGLSVAAMERYDVLLVNPVRDGLNLVAKEGPLLNKTDGVLVLSREAGSYDELGDIALGINPFDVAATAEAVERALAMAPHERAARALALDERVRSRRAEDWLDDQRTAGGEKTDSAAAGRRRSSA